jgi:exosortase
MGTSAARAVGITRTVNVPGWLQAAALIVLTGVMYRNVLPDLAAEWWTQDSSSYGMLVPPVALFLAWQRRHVTLSQQGRLDGRGLWLVGLASLVFLIGNLAAEFFLSRISFVLLLAGVSWTLWGAPRTRTLVFPFLLLATMVPLPSILFTAIAAPLQLFASSVATSLAQWIGVSIYRDGNIIYLANTSLGVAEACSGLNSLSSLAVASLLLGFLEVSSTAGRILLFLLSAPLAVAVNVVRVSGTALLADYQPEFALGFYHLFSGWLIFIVGFGALWLLAKLIFRWTRVKAPAYA